MKTTTLTKRLVSLAATLVLAVIACNQGSEGDRCNPLLSHDECGSGLSCTKPLNCPENYCCPTDGKSSDPYCQPGCNGGQASICAQGGDADCWQLEDGGMPPTEDAGGGG